MANCRCGACEEHEGTCCGNILSGGPECPGCPGLDFSAYGGLVAEDEPEDVMLEKKDCALHEVCCGAPCECEELSESAAAVLEKNRVMRDVARASVLRAPGDPAPEGYSWVLVPAKPRGTSPGEKGHYSDRDLEPIQVAEAWGMDFLEGSALKYLARYRKKGGVESLEKVKWFVDRIIQREKREGRG